jgi:hypothetical protein
MKIEVASLPAANPHSTGSNKRSFAVQNFEEAPSALGLRHARQSQQK